MPQANGKPARSNYGWTLGCAIIVAGIVCCSAGIVWSYLPPSVFWSEEQAQRLQDAYDRAHTASIDAEAVHVDTVHAKTVHADSPHGHDASHGHHHPPPSSSAMQELQQAKASLRQARAAQSQGGRYAVLAGCGLLAAGAMVLRNAKVA